MIINRITFTKFSFTRINIPELIEMGNEVAKEDNSCEIRTMTCGEVTGVCKTLANSGKYVIFCSDCGNGSKNANCKGLMMEIYFSSTSDCFGSCFTVFSGSFFFLDLDFCFWSRLGESVKSIISSSRGVGGFG